MAKNWVVVANNSGARIFTLAPPPARLKDATAQGPGGGSMASARLVEQETLAHPQGRLKAQDIDADRPGRTFQSAGQSRHGKGREVDPKTQKTITFARQVAERLDNARRQGEVERLILVAAPQFLGLLRDHLSAELQRVIDQEFSLDLCQLKPQEIRARLPDSLFGAPQQG